MTTQREVVEAAEVADDRRQRGRDDRLVERGQEHAEHQRAEDRHERAAGQDVRCRRWRVLMRAVLRWRERKTASGRLVVGQRAVGDRARAGEQQRAEARARPLGRQRCENSPAAWPRSISARSGSPRTRRRCSRASSEVQLGLGRELRRTRSARRRPATRRRAGAARRWRALVQAAGRAAPARSARPPARWIAAISASRVGKWR